MSQEGLKQIRSNSSSTIRALKVVRPGEDALLTAILWTHDDIASSEHVLFRESWLSEHGIREGALVVVRETEECIETHDFQPEGISHPASPSFRKGRPRTDGGRKVGLATFLCYAKSSKKQEADLSMARSIANSFSFVARSRVTIERADLQQWTASHVELCFRDAYLSRSDMWRFACQSLVGKVMYVGQKLPVVGTLKATVQSIHVNGESSSAALFTGSTVPVFRSEAARYVIFIQMSREMWDFDSEGNGEIMFNRVVNGFLPELFKKWSAREVRHLVSIILFGRLEYERSDMHSLQSDSFGPASATPSTLNRQFQDFYRVVVTDMASAQWTTILDELKKDFRVYLRDVSLFERPQGPQSRTLHEEHDAEPALISGRLSTALKGNILEAINLAASQFSNDYIDRDLIRTGISTVIVTAGTGVFDVDRDLLDLTSDTLTNNGIGIDIVCLSKMPLHTVPLFRYRLPHEASGLAAEISAHISPNSSVLGSSLPHPSLPDLSNSPAFSATASTSLTYFSRFPSAFPAKFPQPYGYGIPQWIDLSYWSPAVNTASKRIKTRGTSASSTVKFDHRLFEPRVRMYEVQMMGLMEMGMADIAIGYLQDEKMYRSRVYSETRSHPQSGRQPHGLSRSPELDRKSLAAVSRFQDYPTNSLSERIKTNQVLTDMHLYDESVYDYSSAGDPFHSPKKVVSRSPKSVRSRAQRNVKDVPAPSPASDTIVIDKTKEKDDSNSKDEVETAGAHSKAVVDTPKPRRPAKISRNLSSAFRTVALKATAVTPTVSMDTVNAQAPPMRTVQQLSRPTTPVSTVQEVSKLSKTGDDRQETSSAKLMTTISQTGAGTSGSKPIKIRTRQQDQAVADDPITANTAHTNIKRNSHHEDDEQSPKEKDVFSEERDEHLSVPNSIPDSQIPFIRNVNASNPLKHQAHAAAIGRWQHLYPRRPQDTIVKWRSLCMPASVPLTTEDFPLPRDFDSQWAPFEHVLEVSNVSDVPEERQALKSALLLELISVRLAHGYQFVVGNTVKQTLGIETCDGSLVFNPAKLLDAAKPIVMIMGNTVQKLDISKPAQLTITKYVRNSDIELPVTGRRRDYEPYVRTILADAYLPKPLVLKGSAEQYPWELADNHLQYERKQQDEVVEDLRFWRARFVLIPVEPPTTTLKQHHSTDNDEEIHLLGIRALTQLWLKNKYTSPEDKENHKTRIGKLIRRDQKPLEVKMETLNPSELVAAELDRLLHHDDNSEGHRPRLLAESQKLDRDTSVQKIAQLLQSDDGIEIRNRRWHLRLHYNCFRGEELVSWLLENVMSLETRDEAVEMGNELMTEGLFEHVNGRHNFKDGHYFYSLKNEFKQLRTEQPKSWFPLSRQTNRSIPPTPAAEQPDRELSPATGRTTSTSNLVQQLALSKTIGNQRLPPEQQRKTVSLSRMIRVDVDPRGRSYFGRQEVVNIHYDRFCNPENCYHLELDWLNTTCKLIDDAIVTWTNTAEKFGLKLVEVPIAEAFEVPKYEPFRSPYRIKLALDPPKQKSNNIVFNNAFFTATSFSPQQSNTGVAADKHVYQKAILKRFNFVLDLEAALEFPEGVEIRHSWGRLDYKYTQFVHRSGVLLAQILDDGDIIVLANRLYNSRLANTKEVSSRVLESRRDGGPQWHRPAVPPTSAASMQASGIVGLNLASPNGTLPPGSSPWLGPSPISKPNVFSPSMPIEPLPIPILADTFGPKAAKEYSQYITPEQIKDDLLAFCSNETALEQFYKEVTSTQLNHQPGSTSRKATGSGSSSLLRPVREVPGATSDIAAIPAFELPESITAVSTLRRATVAYENANEMMGRAAARAGLDAHPALAIDTLSKQHSLQEESSAAGAGAARVTDNNLLSPNGSTSATQATRARAVSITRANVQSSPLSKATK